MCENDFRFLDIFIQLHVTEVAFQKIIFHIYKSDWEYRDGTCLSEECSKLCSQEVDVMNSDKILSKIRDTQNRFSHKGTLNQFKFNEIVSFIKRSFEVIDNRTDFDVKEIITSIFNQRTIAEDALRKFGL